MKASSVIDVLAVTTVGITAGVMFCYQIAVMPGLHRLSDREFITAFQQIDRKIQNPLFVLVAFLGGAVFLVVATILEGRGSTRFTLLALASAIYILGVVVLTLAWHVPHNTTLSHVPVTTASDQELARARADFETTWVRLHVVRTAAAVASLVLLASAAVRRSGG
jgi:uncharacterized membrane protein